MTRLSFWGASDDLLEVAINGRVVDEIGCYDNAVTITVDEGNGEGVVVAYQHDGKHGWQATVRLLGDHEDGQSMVPVALSLSESGYSARVDIAPVSDHAGVTFELGGKVVATVEAGKFMPVKECECA